MNSSPLLPALLRLRARSRRSATALGFSAIEMMAVVALIGIMVLITTPAMLEFYNSMKVRTAAHRLMSHVRLCRQVSVARRTEVLLELQRSEGVTLPRYKAWEEKNGNQVRNANGADNLANTDDDETWVVKDEKGLLQERVTFLDTYNDITPSNPLDDPGASVMTAAGLMRLRFLPNGQVLRVNPDGSGVETDTLLRMRLQRRITNSRVDRHDVTVNRAGKVDSDFSRTAT
jgi:Tfp pilus assembly protein FimT